MKLIKFLLVFAIFFASCTDFGDINKDPDDSPSANPKEVLTSAQGYMSWVLDGALAQRMAQWSQFWTWGPGVSLGNTERYIAEPGDFNNVWARSYSNALTDLEFVITNGTGAQKGIAKVLKANMYQILVDNFGDVPYTEALKGEGNFNPKYDDDKAIYADLLKVLDDAIVDLNAGKAGAVGKEDMIYGGDLAKWVKFANSLKLRMLMRQSITGDKAAIGAAVKALVAQGNFIATNADIAKINFAGTAGSENPLYANLEQSLSLFYPASNTSLKALQNDPRIGLFYNKAAKTGTYVGIDQGFIDALPFTVAKADFSYPSAKAYAKDSPVFFMTDWETWFLRAEAALVFGTADNDATAFGNGVTQNMTFLGATPGTFITDLAYSVKDATGKFNLIAIEKWKSMNGMQETEAWAEVRRMDTPSNKVFTSTTTGLFKTPQKSSLGAGVYPTALLYPESERSYNSNAAPQRVLTDKVFWDN
jgi:hypothetical protein